MFYKINDIRKNKLSFLIYNLLIFFVIFFFMCSFDKSYAKPGDGFSGFKTQINSDGKGITVVGIDQNKTINGFLGDYGKIITGVSAFVVITLSAVFMINVSKLGASAGNPQARSQAITGLLWTGIAIALVGGAGIIFGFFTYVIK